MKKIICVLALTVLGVTAWPKKKPAKIQPMSSALIELSETGEKSLTREEKKRELVKACYNNKAAMIAELLSDDLSLARSQILVDSHTDDEEFNKIMRKRRFKKKVLIKLSDASRGFEISCVFLAAITLESTRNT